MRILYRLKQFVQRKLGISKLLLGQQQIIENQRHILACQQESLKAILFNDTIKDSEWLKYKNFSPGGWAVDYGLLYTLYRVLNDMKPKNIIEFGLGQSSKMLHQYAAYHDDTRVITCEHNSDWTRFFQAEVVGKYPINIKLLELTTRIYNGIETLVYKNLSEVCKGETYDLILVDGPFGSEHYSRSQLIDMVQDNLAGHFCIIMDDSERAGEQETISEIKIILDTKHISYSFVRYAASKQHYLICSKDLEFLTTMYWF